MCGELVLADWSAFKKIFYAAIPLLRDIHSWTDEFACGKRIRNFEVVCPGSSIWEDKQTTKKDLKEYWGADPVHLTPPPGGMKNWWKN